MKTRGSSTAKVMISNPIPGKFFFSANLLLRYILPYSKFIDFLEQMVWLPLSNVFAKSR